MDGDTDAAAAGVAPDADENLGDREAAELEQADRDELISRLRIIESQPLSERAGAYSALHDELARRLESGPASSPHA